MSTPKRILLLSVAAKTGHLSAAKALRAQVALSTDPVSATHLDVMQFVLAGFCEVYPDFYITLVNQRPALWGYRYQLTNDSPPGSALQKLRCGIERLSTRTLRKKIDALQPNAIIYTHFLPAELLARMVRIGRLICSVWVQVTDFDLHRLWVQQGMARFCGQRGIGVPHAHAGNCGGDHP